jgi:precorrin-6Y C5,15-methyltransferase (decarboxylating)
VTHWLTVVGALPSGALAPTAPPEALACGAVFGAGRLLDAARVPEAARRPWPRPFADGVAAVMARRGTPTTVLASGDPLHFGVAATFLRHLPAGEVAVHPAPSAFSLAAAQMRWPLEDVACVSLHAAPPEAILDHAAPGRRLLVLTRDGEAPAAIAAALAAAGFGESPVTVLETLGTPRASARRATAATIAGATASLNVLAVECRHAGPLAVDDLDHDGCVTRDEVRLLTVAALSPPGQLWDVGAGSGAVAIDFARAGGTATLFERHPGRAAAIRRNIAATGARARLLEGEAAERIADAPEPSRVFLGGAVADDALFQAVWARLPPGGVLVSNAVTVEGEAATLARHAAHGGRLTRIALSFGEAVGTMTAMKPAMPVLQWRVERR